MPALGKRLKPEEITDVVNFVRTLAKRLMQGLVRRDSGLVPDP